ncbi:hypothetical protein VB780_14770 [Leptolyngbya sp. CCNP1308]|uniref:hypothetical protein n=1 Tax=Leptolyngbya sp. CCNP1308 TaxID=3110255 RepID=UPI002B216DA6|nr:hypothetical protein [Leptolyngbya sp. CCNP1308]MEA5449844.1 hypothetical protein [Leptolyngbya sp. CCNP1308]
MSALTPARSAIAANVHPRSAFAACSSSSPSGLARKPRDVDDIGVGDKKSFVQGYPAMPETGAFAP